MRLAYCDKAFDMNRNFINYNNRALRFGHFVKRSAKRILTIELQRSIKVRCSIGDRSRRLGSEFHR